MQPFQRLRFQLLEGPQPDIEMLIDPLPVEFAGHAGELYFTMEGLVRDAEHSNAAVNQERNRYVDREWQAADIGASLQSKRRVPVLNV